MCFFFLFLFLGGLLLFFQRLPFIGHNRTDGVAGGGLSFYYYVSCIKLLLDSNGSFFIIKRHAMGFPVES